MDLICEFAQKLDSEVLPRIDDVTVHLWHVQDEVLKANRSGVLYRIADHHFVLTAGHQLRAILQSNIPLCVRDGNEPELGVPLIGSRFHSTEEGARDIAIIKLTDEAVDKISSRKSFLGHNKVDRSRDLSPGFYVLFGYPLKWSEGRRVPRALAFLSREYKGEPAEGSAFDPEVHIRLHFEQDAVALPGGQGACLPDIHGVSGCGIWRVADASRCGFDNWSPSEYRLVGLQHTWVRKSKYVYGTWITDCLDLVELNYPDTGAAMALVYPR